MLGHAVVLEDTGLAPNWNAPEEFPCAACVPVATGPRSSARSGSSATPDAISTTARRTSSKSSPDGWPPTSNARCSSASRSRGRALEDLATAGAERCGQASPPSRRCWTAGTSPAGSADRRPARRFLRLVFDARGADFRGPRRHGRRRTRRRPSASTVRGALRSHAQYQRTADGLLRQVNLTLWTSSAGDQAASLFCGLIDSREGLFRYAMAGSPQRNSAARGWKSLTEPKSPLGTGPESDCVESGYPMHPGQLIVAFTLQPNNNYPGDAARASVPKPSWPRP